MPGPTLSIGLDPDILLKMGDLNKAVAVTQAEIKKLEQQAMRAEKEGKQLDSNSRKRLRELERVQDAAKRGIAAQQTLRREAETAKRRTEEVDRAISRSKFARNLIQSGALQNVLSGRGSFTDIASLVGSNRIEKLINSGASKLGFGGSAVSAARVLPVAGFAADMVNDYFERAIKYEEVRKKASEAMLRRFRTRETLLIDEEVGKAAIKSGEARLKQSQGRVSTAKSIIGLLTAGNPLGLLINWRAEKELGIMEEEAKTNVENATTKRLQDIAAGRKHFSELHGRTIEQVLSAEGFDVNKLTDKFKRDFADQMVLNTLDTPEGRNRLTRIEADKEQIAKRKQAEEDAKTPTTRYWETEKRRQEDIRMADRNKRFAAGAVFGQVMHLGD